MASILSQVKNISYGVKISHQYNEISNELFNTQNPTKYIHVFQMFTYFVLKKGSVEKKEIMPVYKNIWWDLFRNANFISKLRLIFWRCFGNRLIEKICHYFFLGDIISTQF